MEVWQAISCINVNSGECACYGSVKSVETCGKSDNQNVMNMFNNVLQFKSVRCMLV